MPTTARLLLGVPLLALAGCGGGRGDLGGSVTYQGKALQVGSVSVVGADGIPKTAAIAGGRYQAKGLPAGAVRIAVASPNPAKSQPHPRKKDEPPPKTAAAGWVAIPDKYTDFATSGLTTTLAAGPNSFDIDLK